MQSANNIQVIERAGALVSSQIHCLSNLENDGELI